MLENGCAARLLVQRRFGSVSPRGGRRRLSCEPHEWQEGGDASVPYGMPAPWAESVEELIIDEVRRQAKQDGVQLRKTTDK